MLGEACSLFLEALKALLQSWGLSLRQSRWYQAGAWEHVLCV